MAPRGSVPSQIGTRYRCSNRRAPGAGFHHTEGDGKPTRQRCANCGGSFMIENGYYFVLGLTPEQMYVPITQLPPETAVNAFRTEKQANDWVAKQEGDFAHYSTVRWVDDNSREFDAMVASVRGGKTAAGFPWPVVTDMKPLARMTLDEVENWYHQGVITQDQYEAYMHVWAEDPSHAGYAPGRGWTDKNYSSPEVARLVSEFKEITGIASRTAAAYKPWQGGARAYPEVDTFEDCAEGFKRKRNDFIFICRNPKGRPCDECGEPIKDRSNRCRWSVATKTFTAMHYNCSWGFLQNLRPTIGGDFGVRASSDRVYLVDTDNRPLIYGDDASPNPASFLWPRDVAQAAISTAYVPSTGEYLPAAQVMDPAHYTVTWANRHGRSAWWLLAKEGRTASADTDLSKCPECGHTLQWGRHPGEAGRFGEELAFCPYCEWKGTEDDLRKDAVVTIKPHILKLKQIREGDVIGSFGRSNEVTVKSIEKDVPMLVDGTTGIRLTFHTEISPGRNWVTMGPEETLLVMNPGRRQPPAYEPPPPPQQGDKINGYCPVCNRDVSMKLGGRIPNHNSSKPGRGRGIKGNRCEGSGKTLEEAREIKAEQERKYRLLGYASVGATASVSRTGTPSPNIDVTWTEHDSWREGDPPKDPNYADRYFTFRIAHQGRSGPPVPEPINVIEAMIHDLTAFGRPEFRWEVDGTSQWGDDFGAHGTTTDLDAAKAQAAAAVQRASDEFWAKYDDSETPKGPPGGFPWNHRASKTAAASDDLAFEQDEVEASYLNARIDGVVVARIDTRSFDIRWIDGMDSRGAKTLAAAKATVKERIDRPSYRRLLTEAPAGTAWPKTASAGGCPECGHTLQWGPHPGEAGRFGEELAFCPYCEWKGTEDDFRREAKADGWKPVPTGPEGEAETITIGNLFAAVSKDHWVYRWAVYTVSPEEVMARGMASSMDEAKAEASAALASAPWAKAAALDEPPRLAPGFVVVKVNSHRARQKLDRLVGPSLSYGRWDHEGEFRIIPEEHLAEAVRIAGVTHVKRPETHTDHHVHWDQDPSIPGLLPREALGEKKAPPRVDTLRDEACPVCGETEAYSGDDCAVCGFIKPPDAFMDPAVEKAKEVNLRQDQQDAGQAPTPAAVQCDNCGATFGADGQAAAPGTAQPAAPTAGGGLERFKVASAAEDNAAAFGLTTDQTDRWVPETKDNQWPPGTRVKVTTTNGGMVEGVITYPLLKNPYGEPLAYQRCLLTPDTGAPFEIPVGRIRTVEKIGKVAVLPAPTSDGDPVDEDPTATAPKAGDACPECGKGTLHPVQAAPTPDEGTPTAPVEAPAEPGDVSDEKAPADGEGDPEAPKPDESDPEEQPSEDEDDEDDEANPKAPKDRSKGQKESTMRPTLRRMAQQQVMIESLGEGLDAIARAAGLDLTPLKQRAAVRLAALDKGAAGIPDGPVAQEDKAVFEVVASTRKTADEANPANPIPEPAPTAPAPEMTTEVAKTPQATTDVTTPAIGGEVATENVKPDANTSLQDGATVLDEALDLNEVDVTAPVAGTTENEGAHKVDHDISSKVDSPYVDGPAFPLQGPFAEQAKVTGAVSEGRTFASLRLARLRIQAGIVPAQDDLPLAQAIAANAALTDDAIAAETNTLTQVVTASAQNQQVRPVARSLVPRSAAATAQAQPERMVPSLVTAAASSPVGGPSSQAVTSDEVDALW